MLVLSLVACLLSFMPLTEEVFRIPDQILWMSASLSLFGFCAFYSIRTIILLRRPSLSRRGAPAGLVLMLIPAGLVFVFLGLDAAEFR